MPYPALQLLERKFERQRRIFEFKRDAFEKRIEQHMQRLEARKDEFERKIEHQLEERKQRIEQSLKSQKKKIETRLRSFERKNGIRIDDEVRFIRTWFEIRSQPAPSHRLVARSRGPWQPMWTPKPAVLSWSLGLVPER